ncbi:ATP-binding protein [Piscinibacter sp.]|uniref:ATP-binding protein n=1 Tax=Piscinibacter sp. TaxID=1903157 RepID=UPI002C8000EE|nr:ATP-binding protein [Albitalea sp.]HUG22688.1 ATP-binding protein [Albitalea sp.]
MSSAAASRHDRRDRSRRLWITLTGVALAMALLGTAYVQWRQYQLLDSTTHFQNDALGWSFFQLEAEHLRLRNELQAAVGEPVAFNREQLQLRYDIFVSRVGLVDHERAARIMELQTAYVPTMNRVRAFVSRADRYFGEKPQTEVTGEALHALLAEADSLSAPLHDLSLGASHLLYERATQRNAAVRLQSRHGIALTLFQCVLLLGFAFVVLRQFRALMNRRLRLELLADRLSAARVEAEAASRAKSVFLANMSHEIRTPFHGLLGMMSLLQETPLSAQQAGYLHTAKDSANHLLTILNDILDISKLESGKLQVVPEAVDLARLVREVEALMRVQAQSKGLALQVAMDTDVPRWVRADATRLKQILFNLLSNAVKFTPAGSVDLKVEAGSGSAAGSVRFVVIDTGIGMDAATQVRVFRRFAQGDETTSRRHGGTGLGLEISRSLAQLMGGDIGVESTPGVGSRFTLTLPLPKIGPPAPGAASAAAGTGAPARPLTVLVAEDHPVNRIYLEAVLDKLGHEAVFAENGEEAVRAAQERDFDVVLMDLHMPVMDGFAAARAIRGLPLPRGAMPIVALTADAFQDSQEKARQAGMDGMLTKPAHLPQLRELLAGYGGGTRVPAAVPLAPPDNAGDLVDRATVEQFHASLSPQKYAALLASFFDSHADTPTALQAMAGAGDRRGVWSQAHALKGAALSLGLRAVVERAEALKLVAGDPAEPDLAPALASLERHLAITRDLCQSLGWLPAAPPARATS